jgi:hypothetical protein
MTKKTVATPSLTELILSGDLSQARDQVFDQIDSAALNQIDQMRQTVAQSWLGESHSKMQLKQARTYHNDKAERTGEDAQKTEQDAGYYGMKKDTKAQKRHMDLAGTLERRASRHRQASGIATKMLGQ